MPAIKESLSATSSIGFHKSSTISVPGNLADRLQHLLSEKKHRILSAGNSTSMI